MKNMNYRKLVKAAGLGLIAMMGLGACSEDHFDVQTYGNGTSGKTIIENIKANQDLSDFVGILERVRVKRSETDKNSTFTYAELLNSDQTYTVWAPINGSYDPQVYHELLDSAEQLRAAGKINEALLLELKVENQFVKNHIARFNYEQNPKNQQVRMLNSKLYAYDASSGEFNGSGLLANQTDWMASNGAFHLLNAPSKYFYNIFDYMGDDEDFTTIYSRILAEDKTEFDESQSVPGTLNENGEMVYVDSVYTNNNVFLNNSGALIKDEDSLYIAVIPTNVGMEDALATMRPYFNYGDIYNHGWSNESHKFVNTGTAAYKIEDPQGYADSLALNAILTNMYFSATHLEAIADKTDSASVVEGIRSLNTDADSLISTNNIIFYNPARMFVENPIKASNGYIFKSNTYQVDPQTSFLTKSVFEADRNIVWANKMNQRRVDVSDEMRDSTVFGELYNKSYQRFTPTSNNASIDYQLPAVYSGKYKISVEMCPANTSLAYENEKGEACYFDAMIIYDDDEKGDTGNKLTKYEIRTDTIQKYVLWEEYEFKRCYAGLPSSVNVFPRLRLTITRARDVGSLNIIRVFIEPAKLDGE